MKVWIVIEYNAYDKDEILSVHETELGAIVAARMAELERKDVDVTEWEAYR